VVESKPPDAPAKSESYMEFTSESLIPIQLDLGIDSWSTVVRRMKKNPVVESVLSCNGGEIIHGDEKSILNHVKGLIKEGVTDVKFKVRYD
jgi:hypothetical protein